MHSFGYMFLKNDGFPASVVQYALEIGALNQREKERISEYPKVFSKLKNIAVVESVKASNAIEQVVTTDERITQIINGSRPVTHDEEEIAGYAEAIREIHLSYGSIPFTEDTIRHIHEKLFSLSYRRIGGMYKTEDNLILQYDAKGNASVRFRPVSAEDCPFCMNQMILAYMEAKQNGIPDILLIPCVILDFLCIHPFSDGNGRVARLLTLLLYYKAGFDIGMYISIENLIMESREYYYEALQESSRGWDENRNSYVPFIRYCMHVLSCCYSKLNKRFLDINRKKGSKSGRIELLIKDSFIPVSKTEICSRLPDVSVSTVQSTLNRLVREGKIEKVGTYRNAKYRRPTTQNKQ